MAQQLTRRTARNVSAADVANHHPASTRDVKTRPNCRQTTVASLYHNISATNLPIASCAWGQLQQQVLVRVSKVRLLKQQVLERVNKVRLLKQQVLVRVDKVRLL